MPSVCQPETKRQLAGSSGRSAVQCSRHDRRRRVDTDGIDIAGIILPPAQGVIKRYDLVGQHDIGLQQLLQRPDQRPFRVQHLDEIRQPVGLAVARQIECRLA
jgi:hypothetical protein